MIDSDRAVGGEMDRCGRLRSWERRHQSRRADNVQRRDTEPRDPLVWRGDTIYWSQGSQILNMGSGGAFSFILSETLRTFTNIIANSIPETFGHVRLSHTGDVLVPPVGCCYW